MLTGIIDRHDGEGWVAFTIEEELWARDVKEVVLTFMDTKPKHVRAVTVESAREDYGVKVPSRRQS